MRLYRPVSLALFLISPHLVLEFFNGLSSSLGMSLMPIQSSGFYPLLAVGYMYLVTLLAFLMYRHPTNRCFPILLIHGKLATSILSLALFLVLGQYLIYLTNFIVDGFIGIAVLVFYLKMKKLSG
jgi:hypothetical protein